MSKNSKNVVYEVKFRGQNAYEKDAPLLDSAHAELQAYKPDDLSQYETDRDEAERRYDALVAAGIAGQEIDGVVPRVVELSMITFVKREGRPHPVPSTVFWQYAEAGASKNYPLVAQAA